MTNKEKNGAGYLLSKAAYPKLFNGFRIVNAFQCKDEKKVILNYTKVESKGDTFQFVSTDEYKAAIVRIPIANMPVELTNILQMALQDGRAIIPIYPLTTQHIFIGSNRLDGVDFPDCFEFLPDNIKYCERIIIDIPAKKEGEGDRFNQTRRTIENFIDLALKDQAFELFQKMNVTVFRYQDVALEEQFIIGSKTDTFNFIAIMTAFKEGEYAKPLTAF